MNPFARPLVFGFIGLCSLIAPCASAETFSLFIDRNNSLLDQQWSTAQTSGAVHSVPLYPGSATSLLEGHIVVDIDRTNRTVRLPGGSDIRLVDDKLVNPPFPARQGTAAYQIDYTTGDTLLAGFWDKHIDISTNGVLPLVGGSSVFVFSGGGNGKAAFSVATRGFGPNLRSINVVGAGSAEKEGDGFSTINAALFEDDVHGWSLILPLSLELSVPYTSPEGSVPYVYTAEGLLVARQVVPELSPLALSAIALAAVMMPVWLRRKVWAIRIGS